MTLAIDRSVGADSITTTGRSGGEILFTDMLSVTRDYPGVRVRIARSSALRRWADELDILLSQDQARVVAALLNVLADA